MVYIIHLTPTVCRRLLTRYGHLPVCHTCGRSAHEGEEMCASVHSSPKHHTVHRCIPCAKRVNVI